MPLTIGGLDLPFPFKLSYYMVFFSLLLLSHQNTRAEKVPQKSSESVAS